MLISSKYAIIKLSMQSTSLIPPPLPTSDYMYRVETSIASIAPDIRLNFSSLLRMPNYSQISNIAVTGKI